MAFSTNNPITEADKTFDKLGVSLAISPGFQADAVSAQIVLSVQPYSDADGIELPAGEHPARRIIYGDGYTAAASDPALATALTKISAALQEFIDAKGL